MSTSRDLRERFLKKLWELFRLDQPDLDFGFYRIMHAKAGNIREFIENDLTKILKKAIGDIDESHHNRLRDELEEAIETARAYGAPNPEDVEAVKQIRAKVDLIKDRSGEEAELYDHLYRFFERYYDRGDFLSRRYYTRETGTRASSFAIPYSGEEVKLHWANADQYYIKSTEYFFNVTFDLREAQHNGERLIGIDGDDTSLKMHFRVVQAEEGEQGDIKANVNQKRFFMLHENKPIEVSDVGELQINFEYRPEPDKKGPELHWQFKKNAETVSAIYSKLRELSSRSEQQTKRSAEYLRILQTRLTSASNDDRTLLSKYVDRYTERNTMDYFIHKDLGSFLRRELEFYVKNEVLVLDGVDGANPSNLQRRLVKINAIRTIARKLIDFLAQLENFQKRLWLKKKFVVETNYCITLDRIPEELFAEIANNAQQCEEWIRHLAIDEIQGGLDSSTTSSHRLTSEFLTLNKGLALDTQFFPDSFNDKLIASIRDIDDECDGLLVHSENFQALNLLRRRFTSQVKCVYLDPPYNTAASEILYKNGYRHSSWLTLMSDRLGVGKLLMKPDGSIFVAIDDAEGFTLKVLLDEIFGSDNHVSTLVIQHNPRGRADAKHISPSHEYLHMYAKEYPLLATNQLIQSTEELESKYKKMDERSAYRELPFRRSGSNSRRQDRPNLFYPIYYSESSDKLALNPSDDTFAKILPLDSNGDERVWRWSKEKSSNLFETDFVVKKLETGYALYVKDRLKQTLKPKSFWYGPRHDASSHGTIRLKDMFVNFNFSYPKSINTVSDIVKISTSENDTVLDYFGGSGTTAAVVINLNRTEARSKRKYVLVEMGQYFDDVLKPRVLKEAYSDSWKNGKPTTRDTSVSHCFKYLRLESYEDTLTNIEFNSSEKPSKLLQANPSLLEDYMLRYWLDVESKGSQSLLNVDRFDDPTSYTLKVKKPGTDEYVTQTVDLIETFNYLIGLRVRHISTPETFSATFETIEDPDLPNDQCAKLILKGDLERDTEGSWWFRKIEGWLPIDPANPNNGEREFVLIIWRKLTDNIEHDNLVLNAWFTKSYDQHKRQEVDRVYVNGSSNLMTLKTPQDRWQVFLLEEAFLKSMWEDKDL